MQIKTVLISTAPSAKSDGLEPSVGAVRDRSAPKVDADQEFKGREQGDGRTTKLRFGDVFDALGGQDVAKTQTANTTEASAAIVEGPEQPAADPTTQNAEKPHENADPKRAVEEGDTARQTVLAQEQRAGWGERSEVSRANDSGSDDVASGTESFSSQAPRMQKSARSESPEIQQLTFAQSVNRVEVGQHEISNGSEPPIVRVEHAVVDANKEQPKAANHTDETIISRAVSETHEPTSPNGGALQVHDIRPDGGRDARTNGTTNTLTAVTKNELPATPIAAPIAAPGDQDTHVQTAHQRASVQFAPAERVAPLEQDLTKFETLGQLSQTTDPHTARSASAAIQFATPVRGSANVSGFAADQPQNQRAEPLASSVFTLRSQMVEGKAGVVQSTTETRPTVIEAVQARAQGHVLQGDVGETYAAKPGEQISAKPSTETSVAALVGREHAAPQTPQAKSDAAVNEPVGATKPDQGLPAQAGPSDLGVRKAVLDVSSQTPMQVGESVKLTSESTYMPKSVSQSVSSALTEKPLMVADVVSHISTGGVDKPEGQNAPPIASQVKADTAPAVEKGATFSSALLAGRPETDSMPMRSQIGEPEMRVHVTGSRPEQGPPVDTTFDSHVQGARNVPVAEMASSETASLVKPAEVPKQEAISAPLKPDEARVTERRDDRASADAIAQRPSAEAPSTIAVQSATTQPALGNSVLPEVQAGLQFAQSMPAEGDAGADLFDPVLREVRSEVIGQSATNTQAGAQSGQASNVRQIAAQIHEALANGSQRPVEITLNPQELGAVRMAMQMSETSIGLTIMIERPETLDLLRCHIDQLVADFKELGFENIDLSLSNGGYSGQDASDQGDTADHAAVAGPEGVNETPPVQQPIPSSAGVSTGVDLRV